MDRDVSDNPSIDIKIETLEKRGLLGPVAVSHFDLEESQVVVFVLREVGQWGYENEEHKKVSNPDHERAEKLGVPMAVLVKATSSLRPPENPMITRVS
jgi:hypothetical protein